MQPTVNLKTMDKSGSLLAQIKKLADLEVLVGIPEDKATRKKDGKVNNAQLMFIHTNGSPLKKIPKRPVIEPAIEASGNKEPITEELGEAARAILDSDPPTARRHLKQAGMTGQNAARAWFTDGRNGWPKNSEQTIRRKLGKLKGKKRKDAIQQIADQGGDTSGVVTPLIDTGEMRKAITYVVREGGE